MLKKVAFLGTGGTIAGKAASASDNVGYQAAQVGVAQLLDAIAPLRAALGGWEPVFEQVAQVDSKDMGWPQWLALAQRVQHHLGQPDVAAVVVTHGTDTLEETAYFLSRVLPAPMLQAKPVVMSCAMRPATSLVPDGPQNVLDAVAVAQSVRARGVLAVCAGTVHGARDVQKVHTYRLNAFDSAEAGPLGYVEEGAVRWLHACPAGNTEARVDWQRWSAADWPRVEIVMSHAGASGAGVRALCAPTADGAPALRGIVVAGTGNGTIHHDLERALLAAQAQGVRIVRATRCAQGVVVEGAATGGFEHSQGLSPVKARIALVLELMMADSQ